MADREIVATRLSKLREALRKLHEIAGLPLDEYLASETSRALAEHYLRIALESALDTGNHLIASEGLRKPLELREIPIVLADANVIARDLAEKLARAAGLRNRLVHAYADIDHRVLYQVLQEDLCDLEAFAVAIVRHCDSGDSD